jgi:uncharacterized membrane protein YhaH (DUF805 family)
MSEQYPQHGSTGGPYGQLPQPGWAGAEPPIWAPWYGISFPKAFPRFWKKYGTFSGRASLSEFWWWSLWWVIMSVGASIIGGIITAIVGTDAVTHTSTYIGATATSSNPATQLVGGLLWLATIVGFLALAVRRFHDQNRSGLFVLFMLIPLVGFIVVLILAAMPSNPEGQRFDRPTS